MARSARPAKAKVGAKPPAARKSRKNEGSRVRDFEKRLAEALGQRAALSEILRVISETSTDVQPVFDTIATNALRLCTASYCAVFRFDGELIHVAALQNVNQEGAESVRAVYPAPPSRGNATARAILTRAVVDIPDVCEDSEYQRQEMAAAVGFRSVLAVPMLREGNPIGAISVTAPDVAAFSDQQVELLKTFANQAVIAIENVRLFTETKEALEQQTATSEILRVISSSPTDYEPVFDTIVRTAGVVCGARDAVLWTIDGDELVVRAHHGPLAGNIGARQPIHGSVAGYAVREARVVHVEDLTEADDFPFGRDLARRLGWRTTLSAPLLRGGVAIGAILIRRSEVHPFSDRQIALLQTFADQAVIAIENVRLFTELRENNRALTQAHAQVTEALEQQTATSEILRVISGSPTDIQPVFDTIVKSVARLCDGMFASVHRFDGELLHWMAQHNFTAEGLEAMRSRYPMRATRDTASGRAVIDRTVIHIRDFESDPDVPTKSREIARAFGYRSLLTVPMVRESQSVGAIAVARLAPFSAGQIALLETFADQAVIAIENVRLFNETKEALERQTATSEILRVISSSPTDVQPVFETIVKSAVRLCEAAFATVNRFDGALTTLGAHYNLSPEELEVVQTQVFPFRPTRATVSGRALLDRATVHVHDIGKDPEYTPVVRALERYRTGLSVPMLREGVPIGTITLWRGEVRPFSDKQIAMIESFADQAVIAIENVRLFTELQASNHELTTALDTQTATSDILRVISRSQTDVQPVFDAIVASAVRLLGGYSGTLARVAGGQIELAAFTNTDADADAALRASYPRSLESEGTLVMAIRERVPLNVAAAQTDPRLPQVQRTFARVRGFQSLAAVPLLRHDEAIGAIVVARREPGGFTDDEIVLLQTFADQAVIAIENARLLNELQARTAELTRSVDELTALGDVGRVLSSTLDLETVLQTIVTRANQLTGTAGCTIWEYDEPRAEFRLRASHYADEDDAAVLQAPGRVTTIPKGQGVTTRVMERRQPVQIHDITTARDYESPIRRPLVEAGHRALLGVPLLSEDEVIGVLAVTRKTPGEFEPETVRLLTTFATQSALAIQNARLFLEIEDKSRQLEAASQHKSEFLANMSHELRTPLNAIIGFSEVLSERMFGELNEKQDEYLKDINASGTHLLSLINDILDLSKIEAGRMELDLTEFDLSTALDNALILVRERAGRRNIILQMRVDQRLGEVRADERKIRQVVLNLLSNAIKFTPEGGRIEVVATRKDGSVEVSVSDTGVGIAPEDQEAVFEEFRQVGAAEKKAEGTGLGLALCRKFIALHGGRIWVASQLGVGSTFTFSLPLSDAGPIPG